MVVKLDGKVYTITIDISKMVLSGGGMVKKVACVVLLGTLPILLFANPQFRLATNAAADLVDRPSLQDLQSNIDDPANFFYGLHWEVITAGTIGFGMHGLVRFTSVPFTYAGHDLTRWWLDWLGEMFISLHLFGGGVAVDPFFEIGYGNAGRAELYREISGSWAQDASDLWYYQWNEQPIENPQNLSLYPFIAAGVALDLQSFLFGLRVTYRPIAHPIPGTQIANYPLKNIQATLFGGVAFGGHVKKSR